MKIITAHINQYQLITFKIKAEFEIQCCYRPTANPIINRGFKNYFIINLLIVRISTCLLVFLSHSIKIA